MNQGSSVFQKEKSKPATLNYAPASRDLHLSVHYPEPKQHQVLEQKAIKAFWVNTTYFKISFNGCCVSLQLVGEGSPLYRLCSLPGICWHLEQPLFGCAQEPSCSPRGGGSWLGHPEGDTSLAALSCTACASGSVGSLRKLQLFSSCLQGSCSTILPPAKLQHSPHSRKAAARHCRCEHWCHGHSPFPQLIPRNSSSLQQKVPI